MRRDLNLYVVALIGALAYWILDAFSNVVLYGTSFGDELLLRSNHSVAWIKIAIFALIFAAIFFSKRFSFPLQDEKYTEPVDEIAQLQQLSDVLLSSLSTKLNTVKALEILEKNLSLEATLLFLYDKESMTLYNENTFIKVHFRTKEIHPLHTNPYQSEIEKIAIQIYTKKSAFSKEHVTIAKKTLTLFAFEIKEERHEKILGNLMLASFAPEIVEAHMSIIRRFLQMLSFALSLSAKKELLQSMNTSYAGETTQYDKTLDVFTYLKLQDEVQQEFKRHKRYHTNLTLVLIEINAFKNISNIFPAAVITGFKREFIQLVKKNTRDIDVFAKWTDDRFALLLPEVDFRAGLGVAKKFQALLAQTKFSHIGTISCSFGITSLAPKDTLSTFKLRAESALSVASTREASGAIEIKLFAS